MFLSILSGLIVSIDAFFIGLSLGFNKRCRFLHLAIINAYLLILCIIGFLAAGHIYELIPFEPDYIVGFAFISLGLWTILQYFVIRRIKNEEKSESLKTIVLVGFVMSLEAMLITMGLTFIFRPYSFFVIPLTVTAAHFGYSVLSFYLARSEHASRISIRASHIISGLALIVYGLMALFVDL